MKFSISRIHIQPVQKVLFSFLILITIGAILLSMPFSTYRSIAPEDALFTSTSAVCVTGLIVKDTAKDFTLAGKIIILLLIQFGGLGIMTFSIALVSIISGGMSIKWGFTFENMYSDARKLPITGLLRRIIVYTVTIELIAAVILFFRFLKYYSFFESVAHSVFHAVSAFCNAGFSTFSDNLMTFRNDGVFVFTISMAIIIGGLGFLVIGEIARLIKSGNIKSILSQLSLHAKVVLATTSLLILTGFAVILLLEWNHTFKNFSLWEKLSASVFQSITCRTAGFNTVNIGSLRQSTQLLMIVLMMIGGSPGSIAGGIKTTTITVIIALIITKFRGYKQVVLWGRGLEEDTIEKSTTLTILSIMFIILSVFFILALHDFDMHNSFLSVLFETVSAFGTVGLSMGITDHLTTEGKLMLCLVMYIGRLGPLTLLVALASRRKNITIKFPEEHIMIG